MKEESESAPTTNEIALTPKNNSALTGLVKTTFQYTAFFP